MAVLQLLVGPVLKFFVIVAFVFRFCLFPTQSLAAYHRPSIQYMRKHSMAIETNSFNASPLHIFYSTTHRIHTVFKFEKYFQLIWLSNKIGIAMHSFNVNGQPRAAFRPANDHHFYRCGLLLIRLRGQLAVVAPSLPCWRTAFPAFCISNMYFCCYCAVCTDSNDIYENLSYALQRCAIRQISNEAKK